MVRSAVGCLAGVLLVANASVSAQEPVRLYAAGSLRVAMTEIAGAFEKQDGTRVSTEFGASGLLRRRIEDGAPAEVFASADLGHPQALNAAGRWDLVVVFARNRLCALASAKVNVTTDNLLGVISDPDVRLGTSTPKNDPSGDYTWEMFRKAEQIQRGSYEVLSSKALQLVGGAGAPPPPKDRSIYTVLMTEGKADVFITYCTNAILARSQAPELKVIQLPESLAVGADYGLTVKNDARAAATRLVRFIVSPAGQAILVKHGFSSVIQ
jgi:ABC-type molybdate transport system substrate-binding protein